MQMAKKLRQYIGTTRFRTSLSGASFCSGRSFLLLCPSLKWTDIFRSFSHPKPFSCTVEPRSAKAQELIMSAEYEFAFQKSDAEALRAISLEDKVSL